MLENVRRNEEGLIALARIYLTEKEYKRAEKVIELIDSDRQAIELYLDLATIVVQFDKMWCNALLDTSEQKINALDPYSHTGDYLWKNYTNKLIASLVIIGNIKKAQDVLDNASDYLERYENSSAKSLIEMGEEVINNEFSHLPEDYDESVLLRLLLTYQQFGLLDEMISQMRESYYDKEETANLLLVGESLLSINRGLATKLLDKVTKSILSDSAHLDLIDPLISDLLIRLYAALAQIDQIRADKLFEEIFHSIKSLEYIENIGRDDLLAKLASMCTKLAGVCAKFNPISAKQIIDETYSIADTFKGGKRKEYIADTLIELAIELTKRQYTYSREAVNKAVEAILGLDSNRKKVSKLKALTSAVAREKYDGAASMFRLVESMSYETLNNDGWLMARVGIAIIFLRAAYPKSDSYFESLMQEITSIDDDYKKIDAGELLAKALFQRNSTSDLQRILGYITDEKQREAILDGLNKLKSSPPPKQVNPVASLSSPTLSGEIENKDALIQQALKLQPTSGGNRHRVVDEARKRSALASKLIKLGELEIAERIINDINSWYSYVPDETHYAGTSGEAVNIQNKAISLLIETHFYLGNHFKARNYAYTRGLDQMTLQRLSYDVALDIASSGNFKQALRVFGVQNINRYIEFLSVWPPESFQIINAEVNTLHLALITKVLNVTKWASPNCAKIYEFFYS